MSLSHHCMCRFSGPLPVVVTLYIRILRASKNVVFTIITLLSSRGPSILSVVVMMRLFVVVVIVAVSTISLPWITTVVGFSSPAELKRKSDITREGVQHSIKVFISIGPCNQLSVTYINGFGFFSASIDRYSYVPSTGVLPQSKTPLLSSTT